MSPSCASHPCLSTNAPAAARCSETCNKACIRWNRGARIWSHRFVVRSQRFDLTLLNTGLFQAKRLATQQTAKRWFGF